MGIKLKSQLFEQKKSLKKVYLDLLLRMIAATIIYTALGIVTYFLMVSLLRQFVLTNEIIKNFVTWIELHRVMGAFIYIVIGYGIILFHYWKKPFIYLNEMLNATASIYQHDDKIIVMSAPLKDVEIYLNELRAAIQNNERAVQDAEQRKNDLIAYLAHDLKTPLTSIIGYLSLLDEAPDLPLDQKAKYVHITFEKARRLEKLINEFFDITRYNLQQIVLEKESIDLYYMLIQMIDEFYPLLSAHGNTIKLIAKEELTIYGDSIKLARVFNNILKNAIAYSYLDTEILVEAKIEHTHIQILFRNHGKTIPIQKLNSIFEKFFRLDDARTSNTGGAGLGLAIAKDIVALHGGTITAESESELTTFTVSLPVS